MNAGLPGTGIGGIFYLVSALIMPFFELLKTIRGQSNLQRWRIVGRHLSMAGLIFAGMWIMGLMIGVLLEAVLHNSSRNVVSMIESSHIEEIQKFSVFQIAPIIMSIFTLSTVLTITQLLSFIIRSRASELK